MLFIGVLALAEIAGISYRYFDRSDALSALEAVRIADNISVIASLVEKTPPEDRSNLIDTLSGSNLPVVWAAERWPIADYEQSAEARRLRDLLLRVMPGSYPQNIIVSYLRSDTALPQGVTNPAGLWRNAGSFPEPIRQIIDQLATEPTFLVSVRMSDGTWLNLVAANVEDIDFWSLRSILILATLTTLIAGLSIWAISRLTSPFKAFTTAARRLGTDVNANPIAEQGPEDVRGAIRAFNEMQTRLQRLIEDRTQMLAAVSHDLRTPITRLRLRAEYVENQDQRSRFLADLDEMEHMVSDLLIVAKDDARSESTLRVDLMAILHSLCDELADRGHHISCESSGRVPYLCRPVSIRRCLSNLIDNAIRYGDRAEVSLHRGDSEIMIRIDDSGPGIPEELREEAFQPFYRLEASRSRETGGSGLGLTIARNVARAHGGDVMLSDAPAGGLRVTIVLPAAEKTTLSQLSGVAGS
jgi:signal transduction histidine kinase